MPFETSNEMIIGFAVILGILLSYILSLILRMRRLTSNQLDEDEE